MTLQNEVKGLGWQRKTMTDIYQEGEEEQKQRDLCYVQTLQHVMKSESHLWNEIKAGTYSKSSVLILLHFFQMNMRSINISVKVMMKTNKNQKRKLRVWEKERDMVKSLPREENLVGTKHQEAKTHFQ